MKKILVPTDFSENADNALKYAIEVANAFKADIHLVHSFKLSNKVGVAPETQNKLRLIAIEKLDAVISKYENDMNNHNKMIRHITRNNPVDGIKYFASRYNIDLIIMGTKGASGIKGAIWGSIASKIINIPIPLIAIPSEYTKYELKHIVLAIDNPSFNKNNVLMPLIKLKEKAKARLTTFNMAVPIHVEVTDKENVLETSNIIMDISDDFHQSFDSSLKESIINYTMDEEADMICMIKKKRGFFIDIMHSSSTKKIIFECPVPLLVLHSKE